MCMFTCALTRKYQSKGVHAIKSSGCFFEAAQASTRAHMRAGTHVYACVSTRMLKQEGRQAHHEGARHEKAWAEAAKGKGSRPPRFPTHCPPEETHACAHWATEAKRTSPPNSTCKGQAGDTLMPMPNACGARRRAPRPHLRYFSGVPWRPSARSCPCRGCSWHLRSHTHMRTCESACLHDGAHMPKGGHACSSGTETHRASGRGGAWPAKVHGAFADARGETLAGLVGFLGASGGTGLQHRHIRPQASWGEGIAHAIQRAYMRPQTACGHPGNQPPVKEHSSLP